MPKNTGCTNTISGYSHLKTTIQTRNAGETVIVEDVLDDTEGLVPFDVNFGVENKGTRNFDVGGGQYDTVTEHLLNAYGVINLVYDPYNRSETHNKATLVEVSTHPVDTATSVSVLNVIADSEERKKHIELIHQALKPGGLAFFNIWRGDNSGIPSPTQSNRPAATYVSEIQAIFGDTHCELRNDDIGNTILATK